MINSLCQVFVDPYIKIIPQNYIKHFCVYNIYIVKNNLMSHVSVLITTILNDMSMRFPHQDWHFISVSEQV